MRNKDAFAMSRKATTIVICAVATLLSAHVTVATPVVAQEFDYGHTIKLAERERMLAERMAKEVVLIAMGYNAQENLRNLRSSHDTFDRVLYGLRYGDVDLALEPTSDREILEYLSNVEEIWPLFELAVQQTLTNGQASRSHVAAVADLALPLEAALEETIEAYEMVASQGDLFSMLEIAIQASARQRILTQKIAKDYFMIAYGLDVERHRRGLMESIEEFDRVMDGLMNGDAERLLLPAPTRQIQAQLRQVLRVWDEMRPVVESAARGGQIEGDAVSLMSSLNLNLLNEMNTAVNMYDAL